MKESKTKWIYVVKTVRVYKTMSFYTFWVKYISEGLDGVNRLLRGRGGGCKIWPSGVKKNWNILPLSRKKFKLCRLLATKVKLQDLF